MARQSTGIEHGRRAAWAVLALMLAATLALSAQAARRGWSPPAPVRVERQVAPAPAPSVPPTPLPNPVELAAPGSGSTGTIALPALPPAATLSTLDTDRSIVAARRFGFGRASSLDRARALQCLTAAIWYEAASEPDAGQQAVAQVVLNRVRHPAFPATVCGVVYQGSEKAGCQFSFACDGAMLRHQPSAAGWARAARVAAAALAGRVYAPVGLATHYHTFAVTPAWNRSLVMTDAVGAHFFHRWKGWWGTPAAFSRAYAGGEPLPEPHFPPAPPTEPVIAAAAPVPVRSTTPLAEVQPAFRSSGTTIAAPVVDDHLPPASTVLPQWRESGRMLR